jgi:hypothetical protein
VALVCFHRGLLCIATCSTSDYYNYYILNDNTDWIPMAEPRNPLGMVKITLGKKERNKWIILKLIFRKLAAVMWI